MRLIRFVMIRAFQIKCYTIGRLLLLKLIHLLLLDKKPSVKRGIGWSFGLLIYSGLLIISSIHIMMKSTQFINVPFNLSHGVLCLRERSVSTAKLITKLDFDLRPTRRQSIKSGYKYQIIKRLFSSTFWNGDNYVNVIFRPILLVH